MYQTYHSHFPRSLTILRNSLPTCPTPPTPYCICRQAIDTALLINDLEFCGIHDALPQLHIVQIGGLLLSKYVSSVPVQVNRSTYFTLNMN